MTLQSVGALRHLPVSKEVEDQVVETLSTLEVAGKLHKFKRTDRCRICRDDQLKASVNKMLARAFTYRDILNALIGENRSRKRLEQITYNVLYNHATEHFPLDKAAVAVFRAIQEKNAIQHGQDFIEGVGTILNAFTYLQTVEAKGYETLISEDTVIDPIIGMQASVKLHELVSKEGQEREELMELRYQLGIIMEAVKEESPELKSKIQSRILELIGTQGPSQVEWAEGEEGEYPEEDEDDFDSPGSR
jgi:hypothetical protein